MCDDDCPHCGARHASPLESDDLTEVVIEDGGAFVVLRSPDMAEHDPLYDEIARFPTAELAAKYIAEVGGSVVD
jgi:hypothetical protein